MRKKKLNLDGIANLTPEDLAKAIEMYLASQGNAGGTDGEGEAQEADPIEAIRENADRRDADLESVSPDEIPAMHEEIKTLLGELDKLKGAEDMKDNDEPSPDAEEGGEVTLGTEIPLEDGEEDKKAEAIEDEDEQRCDDDETQAEAEDTSIKMDSFEKTWSEMYAIVQMANQLGFTNFVPKNLVDGKKQIIKAVNPKLKLDGKSREYIDGAYSVAVSTATNRKSASVNMKKVLGTGKEHLDNADTGSGADTARKNMISRLMNEGGNN